MQAETYHHMHAVARSQHGLLRLDQLTSIGISSNSRHRLIRQGWLDRVQPSVYRVLGSSLTWEQAALGVCWSQYPNGWLSHSAAARIYGFPGFADAAIEVLVRRHARRPLACSGVVLHETSRLPDDHVGELEGFPVVSVERCLFDLAAVLPRHRLEQIFAFAIRQRLCTSRDLSEMWVSHGGRGVRGSGAIRDLLLAHEARGRMPSAA